MPAFRPPTRLAQEAQLLDTVSLGRGPGGMVGSGREEFWSQALLPGSAFFGEAALLVTARNLATLTWDWLARAYPEAESTDELMLEALLVTLRGLSPHSVSHSQRVAQLAEELGEELDLEGLELADAGLLAVTLAGYTDAERDTLALAGRVHDVGKLHIPPGVLSKAGPLTEEERALVRLHPLIGECMLERFPHLAPVLPAVRSHHERWDGGGYPDGLRGEEIPFSARLLSLADTYDAMTGPRPYRESVSQADALEEIARHAGSQFDPRLAELFVRMKSR